MNKQSFLLLACVGVLTACGSPARLGYDEANPGGEDTLYQPQAAIDTTCTKNPSVLQQLRSLPRACALDDNCPDGSHCDNVSGICAWQCITTDDAAHGCPAGSTCDCGGRCVGSNAVGASAALPLPRISVDPVFVALSSAGADGWSPGRVRVSIARAAAAASTHPRVHVKPSAGLLVRCDAASTFAMSCDLGTWSFAVRGTQQVAVLDIEVQPAPTTKLDDTGPWLVSFLSDGATPTMETISVQVNQPQRDGRYIGTLQVFSPIGGTTVASANAPVRGWVQGDNLILFDDAGIFEEQGTLAMSLSAPDPVIVSWVTPQAPGSRGDMVALLTPGVFEFSSQDGALTSEMTVSLPNIATLLTVKVQLHKESALAAASCSGSQPCAIGFSCQSPANLCVPGAVWKPTQKAVGNTLVHGPTSAWQHAVPGEAQAWLNRDLSTFAFSDYPTPPLTSFQQLVACMNDLAAEAPTTILRDWRHFREGKHCISLPHYFHTFRQGAPREFMRLLELWAEIHRFVADEGSKEQPAAQALLAASALDPKSSDPDQSMLAAVPNIDHLVNRVRQGLELYLDKTYVQGLQGLSVHTLRNPDHRVLPDNAHDETVGLPVTLLQTTAAYLRLVDTYMQNRWAQTYGSCSMGSRSAPIFQQVRTVASAALRINIALEALAEDLYQTATCGGRRPCAHSEPLRWDDAWKTARAELTAARLKLNVSLRDILGCQNPTGISDDNLPLYFGDVSGDNARFFAASDYLLEKWAGPAVIKAQSEEASARAAWIGLMHSNLQEDVRIDDLKARYGQTLSNLCGLTGIEATTVLDQFDPDKHGKLTVASCFTTPACIDNPEPIARCYRGTLGEAALTIFAAKADVATSRASAAGAQERFDNQSQYCGRLQQQLNNDNRLSEAHRVQMRHLNLVKTRLDQAETLVKNTGLLDNILSNGAPIAGAAVHVASLELGLEMYEADQDYRAAQAIVANDQKVQACFHEADQYRTSIAAAVQDVQRRLIDIESGVLHLANLRDTAQQNIADGLASVARESQRATPGTQYRYWISQASDSYMRDFAWAKRVTYLAMRAVEYELQVTLPVRSDILSATHPNQLDAALRTLRTQGATRTINNARPKPEPLVLSLRDDILHLSDQSGSTDRRSWKPAQRFQHRLTSPQAAIYDTAGTYMGQAVSFTLMGNAQNRCAERLWQVNAMLIGRFAANAASFAKVRLFKRNTFMSRWCQAHGPANETYQVGSTQPFTNLFATPDVAADAGKNLPAASSYSVAEVLARRDVPQLTFDDPSFVMGMSQELQGRGLYGDYILVFSPATLAAGIPLDGIEDVRLRFDFESVDNSTQPR